MTRTKIKKIVQKYFIDGKLSEVVKKSNILESFEKAELEYYAELFEELYEKSTINAVEDSHFRYYWYRYFKAYNEKLKSLSEKTIMTFIKINPDIYDLLEEYDRNAALSATYFMQNSLNTQTLYFFNFSIIHYYYTKMQKTIDNIPKDILINSDFFLFLICYNEIAFNYLPDELKTIEFYKKLPEFQFEEMKNKYKNDMRKILIKFL